MWLIRNQRALSIAHQKWTSRTQEVSVTQEGSKNTLLGTANELTTAQMSSQGLLKTQKGSSKIHSPKITHRELNDFMKLFASCNSIGLIILQKGSTRKMFCVWLTGAHQGLNDVIQVSLTKLLDYVEA